MLFQRASLRNGVLSNGVLSNGVLSNGFLSCGPVRSFMKTLCVLLAIVAGEYISDSDVSRGGLGIFAKGMAFQASSEELPPADSVPRERLEMWKKVDQALRQELPKTALEELQKILEQSLAQKSYPEAARAAAQISVTESMIENESNEKAILRLRSAIAQSHEEVQPVLHALLANWYWSYFESNRWRFQQRTQGAAVDSQDIATWDLARIVEEIGSEYALALKEAEKLQAIPIEKFDALLVRGVSPESYRPTLFDFVAYQALEFYASGEQAAAKRVDAFEIEAATAALGPTEEFLNWNPQTTDEQSPKLLGVRLLQQLIRSHSDPKDLDARLYAELERIRFVGAHAVGEEKDARIEALLRAFAEQNAKHPLSAEARSRLAERMIQLNELKEAYAIAKQGANAFPDSIGGRKCHNSCTYLESKTLNVITERVWNTNAPSPNIRIMYKNLSKVHFRIVAANWNERLGGSRWRPDQITDEDRAELVRKPPVKVWSVDLDPTADYQQVEKDIQPPNDLPLGYYVLLYSMNDSFTPEDNQLGACEVWVSHLAVVLRQRWGGLKTGEQFAGIEGIVVNNETGEPIAGAGVQPFVRNPRNNEWAPGTEVRTQPNGTFQLPLAMTNALLMVRHEADRLATLNETSYFETRSDGKSENVVLLTDRSIYRPGQTIQFKGIATSADQEANKYFPIAGRKYKLEFKDPNGEVIETLDVRTNDYGSFSGSFNAPRNRGTGAMFISVDENRSVTQVRVEEYKRPKFQVTVDPTKDTVKLGDAVRVTGHAMGYTGVPVQAGDVRYRVVRRVRWSNWFESMYAWRIQPFAGSEQEVAQGWAQTKPDGSFEVSFIARPDRSVPEDDSPIFQYEVIADVTDGTGETRSANRMISLGYVTTQAMLIASEWQVEQKPVELSIRTTNLDDESVKAKGVLKVYRVVEPKEVPRPDLLGGRTRVMQRKPGVLANRPGSPVTEPVPDPTADSHWPLGDVVVERTFETDERGVAKLALELKAGIYRAVVETQDAVGKPVRAEKQVRVLNPQVEKFPSKLPFVFSTPKQQWEPGETWTALWGTGYETGRAFVEISHRGAVLQSFWTEPGKTQVVLQQPITESMRGGLSVRLVYVRNNRLYSESRVIDVPWSNKDLTVRWERFRNKLEPGAKEKWTAKITGKSVEDGDLVAEFAAALYDASLDAFLPHQWPTQIGSFYRESAQEMFHFQNQAQSLNMLLRNLSERTLRVEESYRRFASSLMFIEVIQFASLDFRMTRGAKSFSMPAPASAGPGGMRGAGEFSSVADAEPMVAGLGGMGGVPMADGSVAKAKGATGNAMIGSGEGGGTSGSSAAIDSISPRTNLNETAFFFPQIVSDAKGEVTLEFTMPEALTQWRFLGLAHDKSLRSGSLIDTVVTAKDLMIQPNPPRFLREGDVIEFSAKVSNQSNQTQRGTVALQLFDALDESSVDVRFENQSSQQAFELGEKESKTFFWKIRVPEGARPIIFKALAATDKLSDGEQAMLPVLSNKILVREAIPLPIRGKSTKEFEFKKLLESANSPTLRSQSLSVQMTSQPAWYAILALPYLMEYPYDCSEQTFNRMFANLLAQHVVNSRPKIAKVFETWRTLQPEALESPLSKNREIQSIVLEETPWLRDAQRESQARRNVGILFDTNRLQNETKSHMKRLAEMQRDSGMWPWFPGGPDNEYITLYITTGFGRLRHMKVAVDEKLAIRSLSGLDAWMEKLYQRIREENRDKANLTSTIALYLYGRSFFLSDRRIDEARQPALNYWLRQAKSHWTSLDRQSQAHLAVALKRFGDDQTPAAILKSFRERSLNNEELGMHWKDAGASWWWYQAPIETQAMMIEAFDEVAGDAQAVEDCKVWLLKQKQTQDWKTTKATADAVYALIGRGKNLLDSDSLVEVKLADTIVEPVDVERGTGYYEKKFVGSEIRPEMGKVTVTKTDEGVSWGGLHWEYLEEIGKVTAHSETPLKLEKELYRRVLTDAGPKLEKVAVGEQGAAGGFPSVKVGDELVCRVVLRTDRDMEYVHLKDYRGSGTEPVDVLSGYKFQDGLFYYQSTRDTATHFFIDYLRRGTYVFEYTLRVQHAGEYPMGYAAIECMYAPEFNGHSDGISLKVLPK